MQREMSTSFAYTGPDRSAATDIGAAEAEIRLISRVAIVL
jgi:hypothetical protein